MGVTTKRNTAVRGKDCLDCGFCETYIACPKNEVGCVGCGACVKACPQGAIRLEPVSRPGPGIPFVADGEPHTVQGPVSVLEALRRVDKVPRSLGSPGVLCGTGGCWNCAVLINGALARGCVTPLREGMEIITTPERIKDEEPRRIVRLMRPPPHYHPTVFTYGCNFVCGACHNWDMTFSSTGRALSPREVGRHLHLRPEEDYWIGISGGEPTLNRHWLLETLSRLRELASDTRIQLDTNASLLTHDYIDELVSAGVTDISPDLKAFRLETFMRTTGVSEPEVARLFLETAWEAVRYLNSSYRGRVFMAVSLPYHPRTHSLEELREAASALFDIDPDMPVTLIEYQPAFRTRDLSFVSEEMMEKARNVATATGLRRVIVQGGPSIPRALDPLELALSSEEF
ncbi:radical SAM protein [Thermodesulfobacteriota bacterium]